MTYATPEEVRLAEELGYEWNCTQQRGHVFWRGRRRVWACRADRQPAGEYGGPLSAWQTADLDMTNDLYTNHRKFVDLSDALRRP